MKIESRRGKRFHFYNLSCLKLKFSVCLLLAREQMNRLALTLVSLFLEKRKNTLKGHISGKNVLSSSPVEDFFCSSGTKLNIRTAPRPKLFVSTRMLQEQKAKIAPKKLSWFRALVKIIYVDRKISALEQRGDQRCLFRHGVCRNNVYNYVSCSGFMFRF